MKNIWSVFNNSTRAEFIFLSILLSLNTLLETKGFEHMEVAFGVKEKSDNLSDAEKKQFGSMETIQDEKGINLGKASVQPALDKVH